MAFLSQNNWSAKLVFRGSDQKKLEKDREEAAAADDDDDDDDDDGISKVVICFHLGKILETDEK